MRTILSVFGLFLLSITGASAMTYRLASIDDGRCGARCPQAIVGEGPIQVDELERFAASVGQFGGSTLPGTLLLHSPGGNLAGAIKLGYGLRRLGVRTMVARVGRGDGSTPAAVGSGVCASACVIVLMGGEMRLVPRGSRVVVHAAKRYGGTQRDIVGSGYIDAQPSGEAVLGLLNRYALDMGVDPGLMSLAQSVPHESSRVLSPGEVSRYRLASTGGAAGPARTARVQRRR